MRNVSIWILLVCLAGLQQIHVLKYEDAAMNEADFKVDTSHLSNIEMILSPTSSSPHHDDSAAPLTFHSARKIKSYAPADQTCYSAADISPDTHGFIEVMMYQSNYLS
ncbi:hypothetical protein I7V34_20545 [Bacillus sp. V3]|nr:hypothetical protein I7V34_20545 [Bacillus sp. V3]